MADVVEIFAGHAKETVAVGRVSKTFGSVHALRDVSFQIGGPQIVGILGPNGAGKTTLLSILEGLMQPDAGHVRIFGMPMDSCGYPRRRVGVVLQKEAALDGITVEEYAELFAAIHGVPGGRERILAAAELAARRSIRVDDLSGGESQRLFLAAASVHEPELMFLDEPTAQLDPESKLRIGLWLRRLAATRTLVMTTHDLREADTLCDRALFLVGGQLMAQGTPEELLAAVPESKRSGQRMEDAFFHHCATRLTPSGELA